MQKMRAMTPNEVERRAMANARNARWQAYMDRVNGPASRCAAVACTAQAPRGSDSVIDRAYADQALHAAVSCLDCAGAREAFRAGASFRSKAGGKTLGERIEERRRTIKPRVGLFDFVHDREVAAMDRMVRLLQSRGTRL
jgi:hypothetical protein